MQSDWAAVALYAGLLLPFLPVWDRKRRLGAKPTTLQLVESTGSQIVLDPRSKTMAGLGDPTVKIPHSEFGGSSATRWLNCAGSTALLRQIPPMPDGPYAAEGTAAHALAAQCLRRQDRQASTYLGEVFEGIPASEDMCAAVQEYLDCAFAILDEHPDAEFFVEKGFAIDVASAEKGEVYGQNDLCLYLPQLKKLIIVDYKHGIGVNVDASDNNQGKFYAVGAAFSRDWAIREVEVIIVQPRDWRNQYSETSVRRWSMDPSDLLEFKQEIEDGVARNKRVAEYPAGLSDHLQLGPWCKFCDAAAICPKAEMQFLEEVPLGKSIVGVTPKTLPEVSEIQADRLGKILEAADVLEGWLSQVRARVEAILMEGGTVPGWKVVDKQARAKITGEPDQIAAFLEMTLDIPEHQVMTKKLETLTNIEKAMKAAGAKKEQVDQFRLKFTTKESSGYTIARVSDKRDAVNVLAASFQGVLTDGFRTEAPK